MSGESKTPDASIGDSSEKKTAVGFANIKIREYPIIVGDNPSIITGTPITIDWTHVDEFDFSVDDYEEQKPKSRNMLELRLPARNRDEILKAQGFSVRDRQMGMKSANTTKRQRRRTSETMNLSKVAEKLELAKRATMNATIRKSRKQKEREFLSQFINKDPALTKRITTKATSMDFTAETDEDKV